MQTESSPSSTTVLVTGATGYIASHIIKILLEQDYNVRATVRSLANQDKYKFLYGLVPSKNANLSLVEADLLIADSWLAAVDGCQYVIHVASPVFSPMIKDENEMIKPALEGTMNVLNAALEKKCKKVVITSSFVAYFIGNETKIITEDDWSDMTRLFGYPKSKVLAEKAAWEFYEKNKDKIQISTIAPSLVFGPVYSKHDTSSVTLMSEIIKNNFPGIPTPELTWVIADVRDVAMAHIKAMYLDEANGKRHMIAGKLLTCTRLIEILEGEYAKYGYKFSNKIVTPDDIKASGNPIAQRFLMALGKVTRFDNTRTNTSLGLTYHKLEDTVIDMVNSLIKIGTIEDKINL